jgi:hypothetical protein
MTRVRAFPFARVRLPRGWLTDDDRRLVLQARTYQWRRRESRSNRRTPVLR